MKGRHNIIIIRFVCLICLPYFILNIFRNISISPSFRLECLPPSRKQIQFNPNLLPIPSPSETKDWWPCLKASTSAMTNRLSWRKA